MPPRRHILSLHAIRHANRPGYTLVRGSIPIASITAFGVRYYWLVQPDARTLEIYELQAAGGYLRIVGASGGVIDVPGCPELRLDLDAMRAEEVARSQPNRARGVPSRIGRR